MSLGAKKRDELVSAVLREFMCDSGTVRSGIAVVVDMMLAREEARAKPLLEAIQRGNMRYGWPVFAGVLEADAAAQADAPEPQRALVEAVETYLRTWPEHGDALKDMRAALERAKARERGAS